MQTFATTIQVQLTSEPVGRAYSKTNQTWNWTIEPEARQGVYWVGGRFAVRNLSEGYHGVLRQWWEHYAPPQKPANVLLISEGEQAKQDFAKAYPSWTFLTTDMFVELTQRKQKEAKTTDLALDICRYNSLPKKRFDLIINQSTLEHLYDPFGAMRNMMGALRKGGFLVSHTHGVFGNYHAYPRDYFRFFDDWWFDIPQFIDHMELLEFGSIASVHSFACYRKNA